LQEIVSVIVVRFKIVVFRKELIRDGLEWIVVNKLSKSIGKLLIMLKLLFGMDLKEFLSSLILQMDLINYCKMLLIGLSKELSLL
jgi:hypothetical protein